LAEVKRSSFATWNKVIVLKQRENKVYGPDCKKVSKTPSGSGIFIDAAAENDKQKH